MSRHSKNNTSQSIFTYGEKQKLKGVYGSKEQRISQDSIKKFEMCTICNNQFIEPVCCTEGHVFCRTCVIEFMVKQKKKIAEAKETVEKELKKKQEEEELKAFNEKAKKLIEFQRYDNFETLVERKKFAEQQKLKQEDSSIDKNEAKPLGVYELTNKKEKYVKSSFWAIENTPQYLEKVQQKEIVQIVKCPAGTDHKLTIKKLRPLIVNKIESDYCCTICSKQIKRQKIGSYKCGHVVCLTCKSEKCQICGKKQGWIDIESSLSAFAQHKKAEVKTYTHAFYI